MQPTTEASRSIDTLCPSCLPSSHHVLLGTVTDNAQTHWQAQLKLKAKFWNLHSHLILVFTLDLLAELIESVREVSFQHA